MEPEVERKKTQTLDSNYLESFYGDTTVISGMSDSDLRETTYQLRRQWIGIGDYVPGIDPPAKDIFALARQLYPRS